MTAVPVVSATPNPRTVREEFSDSTRDPDIGAGGGYERLTADPVFVVLPEAPDLTCRECDGEGELWHGTEWLGFCRSCRITGVSPVYAATWQWRPDWGGDWGSTPPTAAKWNDERRQVVEWRATDVTVLPVVSSEGVVYEPQQLRFIVYPEGNVGTQLLGDDWYHAIDDSIGVNDLRPGQFVLRLDGWEHLQQPHTEMRRTLRSGGDYGGAFNDLPLSVPDGVLSWIDLA